MSQFQRGLRPVALNALQALATGRNWWSDLLSLWCPSGLSAPGGRFGLRLAVRNNYLNFYHQGQSVARVAMTRTGKPVAKVHVKYAFGPDEQAQEYATLTGTEITRPNGKTSLPYQGIDTLNEWIDRASCYKGTEKTFVEEVVADNPEVIDLEMGLPAWSGYKTALRMDVVAVERRDRKLNIVFWEAKRMSDARIKSRTDPEIFTQIQNYKNYVEAGHHRDDIVEAYRRSCATMVQLHAMAGGDKAIGRLDPIVEEAANPKSSLDVDPIPRLLICEDKPSKAWIDHETKLRTGNVKVLLCKNRPHMLRLPEAP